VGAKSYRELDAWQLADALRRAVIDISATPPASLDRRFCDQLRGAASSVSANVAEGFGRYHPGDFARFVAIARGSLAETEDRLRDGVDRRHFAPDSAAPLLVLSARCDRVLMHLQDYLWRTARASSPSKRRPPNAR